MRKDKFKGLWIPGWIFSDGSLSWIEKILLSVISSLSEDGKSFFMSNEYLSGLLGISTSQVSRYIGDLREKGYVELVSFDGKTRILRTLDKVPEPSAKMRRGYTQKCGEGIRKNAETPSANMPRRTPRKRGEGIRKNAEDIIKSINIDDNKGYNTKNDFTFFVEVYFKIYEDLFFTKPVFSAVDGSKLKAILKKLETKNKETAAPWSKERAEILFVHFLKVAASDPWIRKNYLLSILDQKFNAIVNLKNKSNATKPERTPFD